PRATPSAPTYTLFTYTTRFRSNWSDTATFLMEAEVFHPMETSIVHESYPVIFGPTLNFTLPADAEGICIESDLNGERIVFPLGPDRKSTRLNSSHQIISYAVFC